MLATFRALACALSCTAFAASSQTVLWDASIQARMVPDSASPLRFTAPVRLAVGPSGDVYVAGWHRGPPAGSIGNNVFLTTRLAAKDGSTVWSTSEGTPGAPIDIAVDADGNALVGGGTSGQHGLDMMALKYGAGQGALAWQAAYDAPTHGDDSMTSFAIAGAGDVVLGGSSPDANGTRQPRILKRRGSDGALLWDISDSAGPIGGSAIVCADAHGDVFAVVAGADPPGNGVEIRVSKYAGSDGHIIWQKFLVGVDQPAMRLDSSGDVIVASATFALPLHVRLAKLRGADGTPLWDAVHTIEAATGPLKLAVGPNGDVVVGAISPPPAGAPPSSPGFVVMFFRATGEWHWSHGPSSPSPLLLDLAMDADSSVFTATTDISDASTAHVAKTTRDGAGLWGYTLKSSSSTGMITPTALALGADGVYVAAVDDPDRNADDGSHARVVKLDNPRFDPTSYQGLWWRAPAGSQSGWGLDIAHQGDVLFATWFTYGADGKATWFVASDVHEQSAGVYSGTLYQATGPAWNVAVFKPSNVHLRVVGTVTLRFTDANTGTFDYSVDGVTGSQPITHQVFKAAPRCTLGGGGATSYYNFDGAWYTYLEPGWGINVAQQNGVQFVTWFTYDTTGAPTWFVASSLMYTLPNIQLYHGDLYATTGPAFTSPAWDSSLVTATRVGGLTLDFTGATGVATMTASLLGQVVTKTIFPMSFANPPSSCL